LVVPPPISYEQPLARVAEYARRARAEGGGACFHVVAGRGADEIAGASPDARDRFGFSRRSASP